MPQASIALLLVGALLGAGVLLLVAELGRRRRASTSSARGLEGRHVIVNTRRPDDQSVRGWVRREHADGTLELAQAFYLEPAEGGVSANSVGDVWLPASSVAWVQLDVPVPPPSE